MKKKRRSPDRQFFLPISRQSPPDRMPSLPGAEKTKKNVFPFEKTGFLCYHTFYPFRRIMFIMSN